MMREIKFRGFHKNEKGPHVAIIDGKPVRGEWVYGSHRLFKNGLGDRHFIIDYNEPINGGIEYEVDPATVGQYTGLPDKNGVEIYEGDIVKQCFCKETGVYGYTELETYEGFDIGQVVVIPSKGVCMRNPLQHLEICGEIEQDLVKTRMYKTVVSYRSEVIGNIHENPELLEAV